MGRRNQRGSSGWVHDHYLKGMLRCSYGRSMADQVSKGHGYYYCLNKQCAEPYARADRFEEDVAGLYAYIALPDDIREAIERQLDAAVTEQEGRRAGSLKRLTKQLTALTRQRKKLLKLYYADALDIKTFKSERERIDVGDASRRARDETGERFTRRGAGRHTSRDGSARCDGRELQAVERGDQTQVQPRLLRARHRLGETGNRGKAGRAVQVGAVGSN